MKKIIFFFPTETSTTNPTQWLNHSFLLFMEMFLLEGISIFLSRDPKSHINKDTFYMLYKYENKKWSRVSGEITADITLWRCAGYDIPSRFYNPISEITSNKYDTVQLFSKHFPETFLCNDYEEIEKFSEKVNTQLKVFKPNHGERWDWVFIQNSIPKWEEIDSEKYPYLIQGFVDTSHWFWKYPWTHDYRVVILNWEIIGKFLRNPPKWDLIAQRDSTVIDLINEEIPVDIKKIIEEIESSYKKKYSQRYYSIDFGIWIDGFPKIFEFNSAPALSTASIRTSLSKYIIKNILKISNNPLE